MDAHSIIKNAIPAPLLFCPICKKPFDQETSHSRHVQYCRRRAANKNLPSRPKACQACSKTKTKCDFKQPTCSRCVSRKTACVYPAKEHRAAIPTLAPARHDITDTSSGGNDLGPPAPASAPNDPVTDTASVLVTGGIPSGPTHPTASTANEVDPYLITHDEPIPSKSPKFTLGDAQVGDSFTPEQFTEWFGLSLTTATRRNSSSSSSTIISRRLNPWAAPTVRDSPFPVDLLIADNHTGIFPLSARPQRFGALQDPDTFPFVYNCSPVAYAPTPLPLDRRPFISAGCRQLIVSVLRTYPRMMTMRPGFMPPFIHPVLGGLESAGDQHQEALQGFGSSAFAVEITARAPVQTLTTCIGISHLFCSRNIAGSDGLVWQAIESEQRRIKAEMYKFTTCETLTAIQAMTVYLMMRLIESGPDYFLDNREFLTTLKTLTIHFGRLRPGLFSPPHRRLSRPTWEEWIFDETRRRMTIVCFLTALVVGTDSCDAIWDPQSMPLPSSKSLWEARTRWEWEREYEAHWAEAAVDVTRPRLDTIGDLVVVKYGAKGGDWKATVDDVLDTWHAGLDGLGMLLAAVLVGVE